MSIFSCYYTVKPRLWCDIRRIDLLHSKFLNISPKLCILCLYFVAFANVFVPEISQQFSFNWSEMTVQYISTSPLTRLCRLPFEQQGRDPQRPALPGFTVKM